MTSPARPRQLLILTADSNTREALRALLGRHEALGIHPITDFDILVHPRHDAGIRQDCPQFLRPFLNRADYCLVIFDRAGCGAEHSTREELESEIENSLARNGWIGRAAAVVIDPELEAWVWSGSPKLDEVLGWQRGGQSLRQWLIANNLLAKDSFKPADPKSAMEKALYESRTSRSSALYATLARSVSLRRCSDPAFAKLRATLSLWFPRKAQ